MVSIAPYGVGHVGGGMFMGNSPERRNDPGGPFMSMLTLRVVPIGPMSDRAVPRIGPLTRGLPLAMTLVRVPMVLGIVLAYLAGAPWTAVGLLALFIVVDILDGDVARALNAETSVRRLLDGTLDASAGVTPASSNRPAAA